MLNEFLFIKIEEENIGSICFQQNATTCHTAEAALDILGPVFEDQIINVDRYRAMLNEFLFIKIEEENIANS